MFLLRSLHHPFVHYYILYSKFHYVSIKILSTEIKVLFLRNSKFHYVSIKIMDTTPAGASNTALNSTMFLLRSAVQQIPPATTCSLNSTMFLLRF